MDKDEIRAELEEIKVEMMDLLERARDLLRSEAPEEWLRAKPYWWGQVRTALDKEHDFLGSSMHTMQDSINSLSGID